MKPVLGVMFVLLLSGCARSLYNYTPTMEADPPEIGPEGLALMNELGRAYTRLPTADSHYCEDTLPSFQEERKYSYSRHKKDMKTVEQRFQCIGFKQPKAGEVPAHVRSGFALSTLYCDNFFRRLAKHASQRRFARNSVNDAGAAISTVLGLAAAGSGVTGGAGAAFGLFDSGFRNYDENFLISPDLQTLQTKVFKEQDVFKKGVYDNMPQTYADANIAIRRHANYCSYTGMKALLNEAVVKSTETTSIEEASINYQVSAATMSEQRDAVIAERKAVLAERKKAAEEREKAAKGVIAPPVEGESPPGKGDVPLPDREATDPATTQVPDTDPGEDPHRM